MRRLFFSILTAGAVFCVAHGETVSAEELVVGVRNDIPLTAYYDFQGNRAGSEIELAKKLAKYMGKSLTMKTVRANERQISLSTGKVDMLIAALSKSSGREKEMAFSKPYYIDHQGMLVASPSVKSIMDLNNKTIGVVKGANSRRRIAEKFPSMKIVEFENYYQAMLALSVGATQLFFCKLNKR